MVKGNKVLMALLAILVAMAFCIQPAYSQEKPSAEIIKQNIMKGYAKSIAGLTKNNPSLKVSDFKFDNFKLIKGFVSKTPAAKGESSPYNIEVDYKISYIMSRNMTKWKAEQIKECEYKMFVAKQELDAEQAKGSKDAKKIKHNKDVIAASKENIKIIKKYPDLQKEKKVITKKEEPMSFIKKGNKWYGYVGWK